MLGLFAFFRCYNQSRQKNVAPRPRLLRRRPLQGVEVLEDRRVLSASGTLADIAPIVAMGNETANTVPGELLVHFRDGATNEDVRGLYQAHGITELERLYNASDAAGTRRVAVPEAALDAVRQALQQSPHVHYAEPNFVASSLFTPNDSYYAYQWNFSNSLYGGVNIERAWDVSTGASAIVAVLDTGVAYENYQDTAGTYYRAPDLASSSFVAGYDFINNDAHANDDHSHGTHVAGTIAQSTNNASGTAGIAFDASVMPVKVLGRDGSGSYAAIANGIRWAADQGAHIINMSLGASSASQTLEDALAYAYGKGVTIVAAAGNDGKEAVSYPAAYDDYVIAVSATRFDESLASYSNHGSSIDLAAPGGDTSVDQNQDGYVDGVLQNTFNPSTQDPSDFGYYFFQGTSMAAPHVAGVAALIVSQGVTDPAQVRHILQSTARDRGSSGVDTYYGHGIIDAAAAVAAVSSINAAPVAVDDVVATEEDASITFNVLANDQDADADTLVVQSLTSPSHGELVLSAASEITYVPDANFHGSDSFSYTISDGQGGADTAVVSITVAAVNDAPIAIDDTASTTDGDPVTVVALANDLDVDGNTFSITSFTSPAHGTVTANVDGTFAYVPDAGYTGSDSFSYTIADTAGATDTAVVSVVIEANAEPRGVGITDLDGSVANDGSRWQAAVRIVVGDSRGKGIAGVAVGGRWSNGELFSGTTDDDGQLIATSLWMQKRSASVSFTVESVDHPDYDPALNSDTDRDSDGTSIIVYRSGKTAAAGFQLLNGDGDRASEPSIHALDVIANIEPADGGENGRKALTFDYESITSQFGANAQLMVWLDGEIELQAGDGWTLGLPQLEGDEIVHTLTQNAVEVRIGNGRPWTNPLNRADVDGNNSVEPLDALRVLNLINRGSGGELDAKGDAGSISVQYYDATGDGSVQPIDALQIINTLARTESSVQSLAAGEPPALTAGSDAAEATREESHDEALLAFVQEQKWMAETGNWKDASSYEPVGAYTKPDGPITLEAADEKAEGREAGGILEPWQSAEWQSL